MSDSPRKPVPRRVAGIVEREVIESLRREQGHEDDEGQAPLSFRLIRRLFGYTGPYRRKMIGLFLTVVMRGVQLPLLAWGAGAIINGPVAEGDLTTLGWSVAAFVAFALFTELTFRYRIRWAFQVGEAVIHDLRSAMFRHWLDLTMGYFNRHPVGRLISRLTGDAENVRVGVQNVLFVSLVQILQMLGCAVLMALEDWRLFLLVLGIAPIIWVMNLFFRKRLSQAYRRQSDSFSRITATMAESVGGIRVTQSFGRESINADHFRALVEDHARYNFASARLGGTFLPLLELNGQLFMALLVVIGGGHVLDPEDPMPLGSMVQFFFLAGLAATHSSFGFMALIGLVSLAGVIVSHIIVLSDFIEEEHAAGVPLEEALMRAALVRLRAVLATVFATVCGLIPLALSGGELWRPLTAVHIFGLLFATLLTLVLLPVLYCLFVKWRLIRW